MELISTVKFDKNSTYVLACSFGPDSMALFKYLFDEKVNFVVAHVNYHKRDVSNYEEESLKKYCFDRKIPCEILDTTGLEVKGNFQQWARKIRYDFFKKVVEKYNAAGVLVAHQKDDLIETYLMQKKRGICTKFAGIAEISTNNGLTIIRPFLKNSKRDLQQYCEDTNTPFSIDVSNLTNHYTRNKIRHTIIEKLSEDDKDKIIEEISLKNIEINDARKRVKEIGKNISFDTFKNMSIQDIQNWLIFNLEETEKFHPISKAFVKEIKQAFLFNENHYFWITENYGICRNDNEVKIFEIKVPKVIKINKNEKYKDEFVEIDFSMGAEDRNIFEKDYPLTIKVPNPKDKYKVSNYEKEVRRLFIDWKMPRHIRKIWLGIYSKDGKLIYLPRYRENFVDNHKSVFKIHLK